MNLLAKHRPEGVCKYLKVFSCLPCRYMYFPCSRRQFGLPGPSLLEVGHDERPADGMLASTLAVGFINMSNYLFIKFYCFCSLISATML